MTSTAKSMLMKEVELDTWEKVEEELPQYANMDLSRFKVKKGKPLPKKFKVSYSASLFDSISNI